MSGLPSFSVVTISYGDPVGLRRTVESVRAQRYDGAVEHIVVDGGSGSEVEDYLRAEEAGFAHWQSRPDGGRYDAMNQGIARAAHDLVWLMHSGDAFSDPDALAAIGAVIAETGAARDLWGYAQVDRVGANGEVIGTWDAVPFDLFRFATGQMSVPHQGSFFGIELCRRLGDYDLDFGLAADQLYILQAALLQPPVTVARVVCHFDTAGAGSALPIKAVYANVRAAWELLDYLPLRTRRRSLAYLRYREYRTRLQYGLLRAVLAARGARRR